MDIEDFSNPELVTIAVGLLDGHMRYADREDIAIKASQIAPGRFSWRKYPDRIDLEAVQTALRDAKKPRNGALLVGSNAKGWMLSPEGLAWLRTVQLSAFCGPQSVGRRRHSIAAGQEAERMRLRNTKAYRLFMEGNWGAITLQDFYEFARVNEYFRTKARQRRYAVVDNAVMDDETLSRLWEVLKNTFPEEMP